MMDFKDYSLSGFLEKLASPAPVPGGGGGAALVAAVAISLGDMAGELALGKAKYAEYQEDLLDLKARALALKDRLLGLMDEDGRAFLPLSQAYGISKDDPDRERILEDALKGAAKPPLQIMEACGQAIDLIEEFALKGSRLAVSDAGCGAVLAGAAMEAASLNVFINTKSMTDREYAGEINGRAKELLDKYTHKAKGIFSQVRDQLYGEP